MTISFNEPRFQFWKSQKDNWKFAQITVYFIITKQNIWKSAPWLFYCLPVWMKVGHSSRVLGDEGSNVKSGTIVCHQKGLIRRAVFGALAHDSQFSNSPVFWPRAVFSLSLTSLTNARI